MCGTAGKGVKVLDTFPVCERDQDIPGGLLGGYQGKSSTKIYTIND